MNNKIITKASYEATAKEFAQNVAELAPKESIERFIKLLPAKAKIIDIGCGSGRDAKIFSEWGLDVTGIDFSSKLLDLAKANAPLAKFLLMDIEEIDFPPGSFVGVWAGCSLTHIAKKAFPTVLDKIHSILKEGGYFYLTLKKGSEEVLEKDLRYEGDVEKFWSFFETDELKHFLEKAHFKILELCTVEKRFSYQTHPCLRAFCQKL